MLKNCNLCAVIDVRDETVTFSFRFVFERLVLPPSALLN